MSGDEIVPLISIVTFFATISAYIYYRSRENMALIEKGINPRQNKALPKPFASLKYGLLLVGGGVGLAVALMIDLNMKHQILLDNGRVVNPDSDALYPALIAIGGGIGLVLSYFAERKAWDTYAHKETAGDPPAAVLSSVAE